VYYNPESNNKNFHRCENLKFQHYIYNKKVGAGYLTLFHQKSSEMYSMWKISSSASLPEGDADQIEGLYIRYQVTQLRNELLGREV
jgi:hypothetical protein